MATVVNTPATTSDSSGASFLIGAIVLLIVLALLFVYGLPALRSATGGAGGSASGGGATLNVPDKVDVNVNPAQGGQAQPAQ